MKIRLKNLTPVRDKKGRFTGVYEWEFSPLKVIGERITMAWIRWIGLLLVTLLILLLSVKISTNLSWTEEAIKQWMYENIITVGSVLCMLAASSIATVAFLVDKYSQRKAQYERIKTLRKLAHRRIPLRDQFTGKLIEQPTARQFVRERLRQ